MHDFSCIISDDMYFTQLAAKMRIVSIAYLFLDIYLPSAYSYFTGNATTCFQIFPRRMRHEKNM